jgi:hypothetical protein
MLYLIAILSLGILVIVHEGGHIRSLDEPLQAVLFALLAHHECVQCDALGGGRVQHGGGHRVRSQGQPTYGVIAPIGGKHSQESPDQRRTSVLEGDAAKIDVVIGLPAGGQRDRAAYDRELADQPSQHGPLSIGIHDPESRSGQSAALGSCDGSGTLFGADRNAGPGRALASSALATSTSWSSRSCNCSGE